MYQIGAKLIIKKNNCHAFTLVEVVIYVALVGIVLLGLVYFLIGISQSRAKTTAVSEVQTSERQIYVQVKNIIKSSASINWSASVLGVHPGLLLLSDDQGNLTELRLNVDGYLVVYKNGVETKLSSNLLKVNQLIFSQLDDQTVAIDLGLNYWPQSTGNVFDYTGIWRSAFRVMN